MQIGSKARWVVATSTLAALGVAPFAAGGSTAAIAATHHTPNVRTLGKVSAKTPISMMVALPVRHRSALSKLTVAQATKGSAQYHHWLTPKQFQHRFGATSHTVNTIRHKLASRGLHVKRMSGQAISVSGRAAKVQAAFHTQLARVRYADGPAKVASTRRMVEPAAIRKAGGKTIDITPQVRNFVTPQKVARPSNRYGPYGGYWYDDLKQAYSYPPVGRNTAKFQANGAGETVGIVISTQPSIDDFDAYFAHEGLKPPNISIDPVLGGAPFDPNSGDSFEADLDAQQVGGMAPGAHIVVYSMPDLSDQSVFAAYTQVDEEDRVDVASSSFGGCELGYTAAYNGGQSYLGILKAYDSLFLQGNSEGITFVASSGDSGALGCPSLSYFEGGNGTFNLGIESPADDPNVTAVGGTNLVTKYTPGSLNSSYVRENENADPETPYDPYGLGGSVTGGYWAGGGGYSRVFKEPDWQQQVGNTTNHRSIPDVSLHMGGCPGGITAYCVPEASYDAEEFGGDLVGVIGTSASAPDFAGTMALYNQAHGGDRAGNINPTLYTLGAQQDAGTLGYPVYRQDIPGDNGYYQTTYWASNGTEVGYDPVIGNGTLIANNFVFGQAVGPHAGDPQSPSNP